MSDGPDRLDRFEARMREWARRPPATADDVAARRVVASLEARGAGSRRAQASAWLQQARWRLAAVAVALMLVAGGAWLWPRPGPSTSAPPVGTAAMGEIPPPLPDNVVQFWLDANTPVYFVTAPAQPSNGGTP